MKVLPFKIPKAEDDILIVQEDRGRTFYEKLHQHEEIQLSYIVSGKGTFIIGDTIRDFQSNDVLLFGSNVPHVLKSDVSTEQDSYMISVFFTYDSFGEHFFDLPKLKNLKRLLDDANFGVKFQENQIVLKPFFEAILHQKTIKRFATFFEVLSILTESKYETVSSFINTKNYTDDEGKRMSAIFEFVMNHFGQKIVLEEIATIANMTPNAFCKYFKQRTNKTFFQFLTAIRIENACKFLTNQQQLSISDIAHDCGFFNISNFNRKFKDIKGLTPTEFRKNVLKL
ncbi:RCS-specific HTH-type transcriptional activator RclR [Kordia antarctica]|uniref:RCS-specific HTH-type transcriptional activator RclR n=1 Tax=Kordia antarctica TaxID=1218801 RepID=A0A7L4ZFQ5_9FLAO|nr:helix-turn-helix transcriptional regulator [Kordia antarctica]QHI35307.1 RCS-specific HTH-type transcriptional activator RclR [Kordia antarctica]